MIEKPKRPKKPDIQERQPPRTLQELISRYDLDNTKIYDFLDELVELLNTEKESIDISINDLNNKKVNKSGDTLTGELQFNNKNDYAAIRKTRTINGVDYNVNIGVGANQSGRMEFQDANNNVLGSVEARSDGIYNGKTNRRVAETAKQLWGTSMSFEMHTGQHALVMISQEDCLMIWVAGLPDNPYMSLVRLYGNTAQVSFSGNIVTITYSDNRNFTGNAIIT